MANGQGMAGLSGAAGGAATGAKLGSTLGPYGMLAGAVIGGVAGGVSGASKKKKANEASEISPVDPMEQSRMAELNQITKNLSVGADALTQNRLSELQKVGAQTQGAVSKVSGGDVGSTVQGMLQAQRNTQSGVNAALADRGQLPYFQNLAQQLQTRQSQRKLELDLLKRSQAMAETAQSQTDSNLNANAYASTLMGGDVNNMKEAFSGLSGMLGGGGNITNAAAAQGLSGGELGTVSPQVIQNISNLGMGVI